MAFFAVGLVLLNACAAQTCKTWQGRVIGSGNVKTVVGVESAALCCSQCFNFGCAYECQSLLRLL